ncbi:MAG: hypothetical protein R3E95_15685 [Thiolinea sp.]
MANDGTANLMGNNDNFTYTGVNVDANGVLTATGGSGIINGKQTTAKTNAQGYALVLGPDANSTSSLLNLRKCQWQKCACLVRR